MTMERSASAVMPAESVTVMVSGKVPEVVAVPPSTPPVSVTPGGSAPSVMAKV